MTGRTVALADLAEGTRVYVAGAVLVAERIDRTPRRTLVTWRREAQPEQAPETHGYAAGHRATFTLAADLAEPATRTCANCGAPLAPHPDGWVDARSGDDGGTFDYCPDGPGDLDHRPHRPSPKGARA